MALNTTATTSAGHSPSYVVFGREKMQTGNEHPILADANEPVDDSPEQTQLIHEEVYVKSKELSSAANEFAAKLAPSKKIAIVSRAWVVSDMYELKAADGSVLGIYHASMICLQ